MTKKSPAARKSRTHFDQVPLKAVKKIAEGADSGKDKVAADKARARKGRR